MSVPRDMARQPNPELDGREAPTTKIRRLARHGDLGEPRPGAEDVALSNATGNDPSGMRAPLRPTAQRRAPAPAGWGYATARSARTLQRRDVAFLLSSLGLVLALVLVATAMVLGPVLALYSSHSSPGPPVAAGTPLATSPPTATAPATAATFVALDTTTQGNWQEAYGSAGYLIAGDTQQLPASIQVTPSGTRFWEWIKLTTQARALVRPEDPPYRVAACWNASTTLAFDVNITDGHPYQLALYALDFDQRNHRVETVSVVDPSSGRVLDTRQLRAFGNGEYLVWQVSGHIAIQVTNGTGSINAVASGLFFAPAAHT